MQHIVKEIPIYYEILGSGMPVLMIHGWSVDHRLMKGCMEPVLKPWSFPGSEFILTCRVWGKPRVRTG